LIQYEDFYAESETVDIKSFCTDYYYYYYYFNYYYNGYYYWLFSIL